MTTLKHTIHNNGAAITAYEWGDKTKPSILLLHGYPDTHDVWHFQIEALAAHYHVLAFDLRGVGESSRTGNPFEYRINNMLKDIHAVVVEILGEKKFHLVGHDWGSVLGWSYVFHPSYSQAVLSWSSFSGPHLGLMLRAYLKCFVNPKTWFEKVTSVSGEQKYQLAEIMRTFAKYASVFPALAAVRFSPEKYQQVNNMLVKYGYPEGDATLAANSKQVINRFFNTMHLYITNIPLPPPIPNKKSCDIPTQIITPTRDEFVRPWLYENYHHYVNHLRFKEIDAQHWVQRSHPKAATQFIKEFIEEAEHEIISE